MTTRLVATCWSGSTSSLEAAVRGAASTLPPDPPDGPHLVEARLDLLGRPPSREEASRIAAAASGRLLATCRRGGPGAPGSDADRVALLRAAVAEGAHAMDVEDDVLPALRPEGPRVLVSWHADGERAPRPEDVAERLGRLAARPPWAIKAALPAGAPDEVLAWAVRAAEAIPAGTLWVPVATGSRGTWLRRLAGRPGPGGRPLAALAYVAGGDALPGPDLGQVPLAEAVACRVHATSEATRVHGVFGWPLQATWSPGLHGRLFAARGIDAALVALPVRDADELLRAWRALELAGAAVTAPHKQAGAALGVRASERVLRAGSLNTLRRGAGGIEAESFDGPAAAAALAAVRPLAGSRIVLLGAGGAARALVPELVARGAAVTVLARSPRRAREAAEPHGAAWGSLGDAGAGPADVLVNATPVGSLGQPGLPVPPEMVRAGIVMDLVTTPVETPLLALARTRGLRAVDGLGMLARQAAAQQRWWFEGAEAEAGAPAPDDAEVEAVLRALVATGAEGRA